MTARENRRDELFDLLVALPDGVTVDDIKVALACSHRQANDAVHDLRLFLGSFDDVNLPANPNGPRERWTYVLVGNLDGCREWMANRVGDTHSRIRTMQAMMASCVQASDGRTVDGKRARVIERALRRLLEDLDDLAVA
jgi:hypothetical protein